MRLNKAFFILIIFFSLSGCESEIPQISINDSDSKLKKSKGKMYFDGQLFSGFITRTYSSGNLKSKTGYINGWKEGKAEEWYPDGKNKEIRFYTSNKKVDLHQGWWPNGNLKFQLNFQLGKYEGVCKQWHEDGALFTLKNYLDGKENGSQKSWGKSGKIEANYVVKSGRRYGMIGSKPCGVEDM